LCSISTKYPVALSHCSHRMFWRRNPIPLPPSSCQPTLTHPSLDPRLSPSKRHLGQIHAGSDFRQQVRVGDEFAIGKVCVVDINHTIWVIGYENGRSAWTEIFCIENRLSTPRRIQCSHPGKTTTWPLTNDYGPTDLYVSYGEGSHVRDVYGNFRPRCVVRANGQVGNA